MKNYKLIAEKQAEIITKYNDFINYLKTKPNYGNIAIAAYDLQIATLKSELSLLESQEVEGVSIDEILKGCEHDGSYIPVSEVRRLLIKYAQSSKIDEKFIRENIPFAIKPSKASSTAFISPFSSNYAREQVIKALVEAINKI